jgi:YgiT-type zinc finger domain-containing protein
LDTAAIQEVLKQAVQEHRIVISLHAAVVNADPAGRSLEMKCVVQGCPGEMEQRQIVHTFVRNGRPMLVEDLPARVCPVCGYTVLDLQVLDKLFALDTDKQQPVSHAPVFRLSLTPA